MVSPITSGFGVAACAHTRLCAQGPKKLLVPASVRPVALSRRRRLT